ncbi:MAG: PEP/pyruvate-binding domain-containing protein [Bacteroidota bacterium]|nr:PEP/pyruvate-binding domain-containing protein [Bacteroidota bacterium]
MKNLLLYAFVFCQLTGCKAQPQRGCEYKGGEADYLSRITCVADFNYIKGRPLTEKFGHAESIKVVYSIRDRKIYFTNSSRFPYHFDFCTSVLREEDDLSAFNNKNYKTNKVREYILCNINFYAHLDVYALELMPEDDSKAEVIYDLYKQVAALTFFAHKIKVLVSSPEMEKKLAAVNSLPLVLSDDIYKGRQYVSLHKGGTFGYLRKVDSRDFEKFNFDKHDIVILNGLPNQLPVVAGVLTVPFQTPLCHISLLCQNRGTPNATYRKAWTDEQLKKLENHLVYYEVTADTFLIRSAGPAEATIFWKKTEDRKPIRLSVDTTRRQLMNMENLGFKNVSLVGGKAANFAELNKIKVDKKPLPIPEGAFAIPFYFYYQHLQQNNIIPMLDSVLYDPVVLSDPKKLDSKLKQIRTIIKEAPLNKEFLQAVLQRLQANRDDPMAAGFVNYRFRSSTNAEDVKGFNGAGLYESKTGSLTDPTKPVEKAIKAVWASLWDERAFAERQYFKIDQHSVAMGILVHRAFGEELSNGVAITKHLYRDNYPAYTINVQVGEISVVTPPDSVTCDEAIISLGEVTGSKNAAIEYIGRSSLSKEKPVLTNEQIALLARYLTAIKEHFFYKVEKGNPRGVTDFWNYGLDIEFKIDAHSGNLYIKQARSL